MIKDTEFFTTTELAKKLKMNVQVLTRKVQAGDIEAYKIGKEWRIPEKAVARWLEQNSNRRATTEKSSVATATAQAERIIAGRAGRKDLLDYILAQFEPQREYSEQEVDRIIGRFHADSRQIRHQFVDEQMMERVNGQYRRRPNYKLIG